MESKLMLATLSVEEFESACDELQACMEPMMVKYNCGPREFGIIFCQVLVGLFDPMRDFEVSGADEAAHQN